VEQVATFTYLHICNTFLSHHLIQGKPSRLLATDTDTLTAPGVLDVYTKKMSNLQYFAYEGVGQRNLKQHGYSQAVRVGDRIECAGQGEREKPQVRCEM
jgi:hypothetical protein